MNIIILLSICSLGSLNAATQLDPKNCIKVAATHAQEGDYAKALETYQGIEPKYADLYTVMGSLASKLEKQGLALFYWRCAEKRRGFLSRNELALSIMQLKSKLAGGQKMATSPWIARCLLWKNIVLSWIKTGPLVGFQLLFLCFWVLLFAYIRFLYNTSNRWLIIVLFVITSFFGIVLAIRYNFEYNRYGVIVAKNATLFSGPDSSYQVIGKLAEADEIKLLQESDEFIKIRKSMRSGWVHKQQIGVIE